MSGIDVEDTYSDELLQDGQILLCRPIDWNERRHIKQMRAEGCGAFSVASRIARATVRGCETVRGTPC